MIDEIMADIERNAAEMSGGGTSGGGLGGARFGSGGTGADLRRLHALSLEIDGLMSTLGRTKDITLEAPITSHRLLKRIIRKMTFWLIEPAQQQQRVYNNAVFKTLERMRELNAELIKSLDNTNKIVEE